VTADAVQVDASNSEQFRAWNEQEGAFWAANADYFDRSARQFHRRLLEAAALGHDERVLDIGCGSGQTSVLAAQAAAAGTVLGVDLSAPLLARARERAAAAGVDNVSFVQADAQIHSFEAGAFDAAISSMGAMFFGDPVAAFANIRRALGSGARMVLVTWQPMGENEWLHEFRTALAVGRDLPGPSSDAPGPFGLSDARRVRDLLGTAGFSDIDFEDAREPMWFGDSVSEASQSVLGIFGWMLEELDDDARERALDALHASMDAHHTPDGVVYDAAVWVIRGYRP
jgi:SAM-dependent methyltransferase